MTRKNTDSPAVSLRLVPFQYRSLPVVLFSGLDGVKRGQPLPHPAACSMNQRQGNSLQLPKDQASQGRRSCQHRLMPAGSSSEPPVSGPLRLTINRRQLRTPTTLLHAGALRGVEAMVRRIVIGTAIAAAAICTAPIAAADDVPGMDYNAVRSAACQTNGFLYIFGRGPSGETLACVYGRWQMSAPLVGVREIGAPCNGELTAQSPDGRPLICVTGQGFQPGP